MDHKPGMLGLAALFDQYRADLLRFVRKRTVHCRPRRSIGPVNSVAYDVTAVSEL